MDKKKGTAIVLFTLVVFYLLNHASLCMACCGGIYANRGLDAVIAIDTSGSMAQNDPKEISKEAAKMFIDMCNEKKDRVGVIAYNDKIVSRMPLMEIKAEKDRQTLKDVFLPIDRKLSTDIGLALKKSVEMLEESSKGNKQAIILLSDGKNDLRDSNRTREESEKDWKEAINTAQSEGIAIYTIGLDVDGSIDAEALKQISDATGGKAFVTGTADDLTRIISEIFADNMDLKNVQNGTITAGDGFQDVKIEIPDENVLKANISILHAKPLELKLLDSGGKELPLSSDGISIVNSGFYSLIKFSNPKKGMLTLQLKGAKGDRLSVATLLNRDFDLVMEVLPGGSLHRGDTVSIKAYITREGRKLVDKSIYKNAAAILSVTDLDTDKEEKISLQLDNDMFTGEYTFNDSHRYIFSASIESQDYYKKSEVFPFMIAENSAAGEKEANGKLDSGKKRGSLLKMENRAYIWAVAVILLCAATGRIFVKRKASFKGELLIEIRDENNGLKGNAIYVQLEKLKGRTTLYRAAKLAEKYKELDRLVLMPGKNGRLRISNRSSAVVQKSGNVLQEKKDYDIRSREQLIIAMDKPLGSISMEYYA